MRHFQTESFAHPFILSIGPQRAGTSWLDRYMRHRGDICLPSSVKEVFFFDRYYQRGISFYHKHFQPTPDHRYLMEVSTTAFDTVEAPKRVFDTFGHEVTLLCPLRHPVIRSYSLYQHYKRYGLVTGSLPEACAQNPQIIESSRYSRYLQEWYRYFPQNRIKILFQEDLELCSQAYVKNLCHFLKLDFIPVPDSISGRMNETTAAPIPFLAKSCQHLADFLRQHRLYAPINMAKRIGLKPFIFGRDKPQPHDSRIHIDYNDFNWLCDQLNGEIEALEALIGPISQWRFKDNVPPIRAGQSVRHLQQA